MKLLTVTVFVLATVASARKIDLESVIDLEDNTAYGYLSKVGAPLAEKIHKTEEEANQNASKIIGGEPSRLSQFPYQAGIIIFYATRQGVCGGSLLNTRRVVTAAHCWYDRINQAWRFTIVLGTIQLFNGGTRLVTSDVILHPNFWPLSYHDIAMVNLPFAVGFSGTIAPIALPSGNEVIEQFVGAIATASGFGITSEGGSIAIYQCLSHLNMPVISNAECRMFYLYEELETNVYTRGPRGQSPCSSDSGGPLVVTSNNRRILIGVVSFGSTQGCTAGYPAVYSRITSFLTGINQLL